MSNGSRARLINRTLLILGLLLLVPASLLLGTQTTLFGPDGFTGTAGTNLPTYNASYINNKLANQWNQMVISTPNGFTVRSSGQTGVYVNGGLTFTNSQFGQATLNPLPATNAMKVCVQLAGDVGNNPSQGYCVGPDPNISGQAYRLFDVSTGQIAASATSAVAGDVINIEIISGTVTVRVNGGVLNDLTTSSLTATGGFPGMYANDGTAKFTAFSAGSASSGGGGATCHGALTLMGAGGC